MPRTRSGASPGCAGIAGVAAIYAAIDRGLLAGPGWVLANAAGWAPAIAAIMLAARAVPANTALRQVAAIGVVTGIPMRRGMRAAAVDRGHCVGAEDS